MWSLENRLTSDALRASRTRDAQERAQLFGEAAATFLNGEEPSTMQEWLDLMHKQELLHQLEMEKWEEMLGAAAELLRKVIST